MSDNRRVVPPLPFFLFAAHLCGGVGVLHNADHTGLPVLWETVPGTRRVRREAGEMSILWGRRVGPGSRGCRGQPDFGYSATTLGADEAAGGTQPGLGGDASGKSRRAGGGFAE